MVFSLLSRVLLSKSRFPVWREAPVALFELA